MKNLQRRHAIVSVVLVQGTIEQAFNELMLLLGGMETIVLPFQNVLIKPNWVNGQSYQTGAVTHPGLIESCIHSVKKCGARNIHVGDSSMVGVNTEEAIDQSGLRKLQSRRIQMIDFKKSEYMPVGIPGALRYRRLSFPKELMEAQVVINMPVMKTHDILPVTLGLKNMKGVLLDVDKRRFHTTGLEEGIIDTNRVALADLTIVDGIIGMQGNGPTEGIPANVKVLIASTDPLAAEVCAIKIMGMEPSSMHYIQMAYDAGFGMKDFDKIEIVGADIEKLNHKFQKSRFQSQELSNQKLRIHMDSACSSCRFILKEVIEEQRKASITLRKNVDLFCGFVDNREIRDITIGAGRCCQAQKELCDIHIPGCPPKKKEIQHVIKELEVERSISQ